MNRKLTEEEMKEAHELLDKLIAKKEEICQRADKQLEDFLSAPLQDNHDYYYR